MPTLTLNSAYQQKLHYLDGFANRQARVMDRKLGENQPSLYCLNHYLAHRRSEFTASKLFAI